MSVIVAIKENGVIYMGADSQTTAGRRKFNKLNETAYKVTRLKNGMLVGFCGSVSASQTILSMQDVFTLNEQGGLTKKHIVNHIIPKLVGNMDKFGDDENGELGVSVLLAYKDKLYRIDQYLNVLNMNEYDKTGAGDDLVDYAVLSTKGLPVKERLIKALVASARRTDSVSGPFVLIDTQNLEYEVINMGVENY